MERQLGRGPAEGLQGAPRFLALFDANSRECCLKAIKSEHGSKIRLVVQDPGKKLGIEQKIGKI